MTSFDDAFTKLMGAEGRYVNNPADPGGETMWGITARVARAQGYTGAMKSLPQATAKTIAKTVYWNPLHLDEFDSRIAFQCFDANYNGGHTVLWMQQCSGATADGSLGPETIAAVKAADPQQFVMLFISKRIIYLTAIKTWPTFGKGWMNRMAKNLTYGAGDAVV